MLLTLSDNPSADPESQQSVGFAHQVIGIVLIPMLGIQVLAGLLLRPLPTSRLRPLWNYAHHNWGRLTLLLGGCNVFLGARRGQQALAPETACRIWGPELCTGQAHSCKLLL